MSVPTFYVCPHLLCLSPPIMSVPTFHVCPHILCLSPPFMSVPTYYVCPHLLCLSPPIMSLPTYYVCPFLCSLFFFCLKLDPILWAHEIFWKSNSFWTKSLIWPTQLRFRVWHSQLSLFHFPSFLNDSSIVGRGIRVGLIYGNKDCRLVTSLYSPVGQHRQPWAPDSYHEHGWEEYHDPLAGQAAHQLPSRP